VLTVKLSTLCKDNWLAVLSVLFALSFAVVTLIGIELTIAKQHNAGSMDDTKQQHEVTQSEHKSTGTQITPTPGDGNFKEGQDISDEYKKWVKRTSDLLGEFYYQQTIASYFKSKKSSDKQNYRRNYIKIKHIKLSADEELMEYTTESNLEETKAAVILQNIKHKGMDVFCITYNLTYAPFTSKSTRCVTSDRDEQVSILKNAMTSQRPMHSFKSFRATYVGKHTVGGKRCLRVALSLDQQDLVRYLMSSLPAGLPDYAIEKTENVFKASKMDVEECIDPTNFLVLRRYVRLETLAEGQQPYVIEELTLLEHYAPTTNARITFPSAFALEKSYCSDKSVTFLITPLTDLPRVTMQAKAETTQQKDKYVTIEQEIDNLRFGEEVVKKVDMNVAVNKHGTTIICLMERGCSIMNQSCVERYCSAALCSPESVRLLAGNQKIE
jgi:hypothetical protein